MADLQINDITWQVDAGSFIPIIRLWNRQTKEFNSFPLKGYKFNFILSKDKFCTGYTYQARYLECPYKNKIVGNFSSQCGFCERTQGFKSSFILGDLSHERSNEILSQEYCIYLGYFEPGIIKVGTANISREKIRLIEQDCLIFAFIAKGRGYEIQKLEHLISKKLNITEIVKSSHKFKYLSLKPDIKFAEEKLKSIFDKIKAEFESDIDYSTLFFEKINVENFLENAELFFPEKYKKFEDTNIFGHFLGLRGRYLLLAANNNVAALDINYLIGRNIEDYLNHYEYNFTEEQLSLI